MISNLQLLAIILISLLHIDILQLVAHKHWSVYVVDRHTPVSGRQTFVCLCFITGFTGLRGDNASSKPICLHKLPI